MTFSACAIQGHSGGKKVDPSLQDDVDIPYHWIDYMYHVGSSNDCSSILKSGLRTRGKRCERRTTNRILHSSGSYERTTRG